MEILVGLHHRIRESRTAVTQQILGRGESYPAPADQEPCSLEDDERKTVAEIGKKLGKKALEEVAIIVTPDTILAWHRKPAAQKFDGSLQRRSAGCPRIDEELEALVVRIAQENRSWGYDRIVGALVHLGYTISDQTVGNILKRHGIPPAPTRRKTTTWNGLICTHMDILGATDFFTAEIWTTAGLATYYVLCDVFRPAPDHSPANAARSSTRARDDSALGIPAR